MILYKLAKWMEELSKLDTSIRDSQGDVRFLQLKKDQVEKQMLLQAQTWLNVEADSGQAAYTDPEAIPLMESISELEQVL